jgi:hypothetical protein
VLKSRIGHTISEPLRRVLLKEPGEEAGHQRIAGSDPVNRFKGISRLDIDPAFIPEEGPALFQGEHNC